MGSEMDWKRVLALLDRFDDLKQVTGGSREPVELPTMTVSPRSKLVEHTVEFRSIAVGLPETSRKVHVQPAFLRASRS